MCIRDRLDTVVIIGVVAGGDHDAAIKVIHASDVSPVSYTHLDVYKRQ